jgi:hypothetical protein
MTRQAKYKRVHRVRTGQQKTIPIPTTILAAAISSDDAGPISRHLGQEMVDAVLTAAERMAERKAS